MEARQETQTQPEIRLNAPLGTPLEILPEIEVNKETNTELRYLQTVEFLIDQWMGRLKPTEFIVLLYIVRRTLGWRKNSDPISLSQFTQGIQRRDGTILDHGTGLCRSTVLRALRKLEKENFIQIVPTSSQGQGGFLGLTNFFILCPLKYSASPENLKPTPSGKGSVSISRAPSLNVTKVLRSAQVSPESKPEPVQILNRSISNTGTDSILVQILHQSISATSTDSEPVQSLHQSISATSINSEPVQILDQSISATGIDSEPVQILDQSISATGINSEPVQILDQSISATGTDSIPVQILDQSISATGTVLSPEAVQFLDWFVTDSVPSQATTAGCATLSTTSSSSTAFPLVPSLTISKATTQQPVQILDQSISATSINSEPVQILHRSISDTGTVLSPEAVQFLDWFVTDSVPQNPSQATATGCATISTPPSSSTALPLVPSLTISKVATQQPVQILHQSISDTSTNSIPVQILHQSISATETGLNLSTEPVQILNTQESRNQESFKQEPPTKEWLVEIKQSIDESTQAKTATPFAKASERPRLNKSVKETYKTNERRDDEALDNTEERSDDKPNKAPELTEDGWLVEDKELAIFYGEMINAQITNLNQAALEECARAAVQHGYSERELADLLAHASTLNNPPGALRSLLKKGERRASQRVSDKGRLDSAKYLSGKYAHIFNRPEALAKLRETAQAH